MKKIIIIMLYCLFFQHIIASEQNNEQKYELIPIAETHHKIVHIRSCEGLRRLVLDKNEKWEVLSQKYSVSPKALAEYVCNRKITDSPIHQEIFEAIDSWQRKTSNLYDILTEQIITEIRQHDKGHVPALQKTQQQFYEIMQEKSVSTEKQIITVELEYKEKQRAFMGHATCNTILAVLLIGGWTAVGLFSWVINHCHHPWD
jgi:hypothetical protein